MLSLVIFILIIIIIIIIYVKSITTFYNAILSQLVFSLTFLSLK